MDSRTSLGPSQGASPAPEESETTQNRPRRRLRRVLFGAALVLLVFVVAAGLWFFLGRDQAKELSDIEAVAGFRAGGGDPTADPAENEGRPVPGVYTATASGSESIGLPGFDESLGPGAPVTVTYGDDGCFIYRVDFNSHHWRSWTFCPAGTATFALQRLDSWTARKAPALDIATLSTYRCDVPVDYLWPDMADGDRRTGVCTGTTDSDDSVTDDNGDLEVLDVAATMKIDGTDVAVVHLRSADTLSGDQTGSENGEWWLDATTGLPLRVSVASALGGGLADYSEQFDVELSTLTPAT